MDERDRPANELLYDTEAALRLVDKALDEIRGLTTGTPEGPRDGLAIGPPTVAPSGAPAALTLVRQPEPAPPRPALAAELTDILEDIRLGRALLDRARSRRRAPAAAGGSIDACAAIAEQYVDGASHLLADLEQRVGRLAEMLREAGGGTRSA